MRHAIPSPTAAVAASFLLIGLGGVASSCSGRTVRCDVAGGRGLCAGAATSSGTSVSAVLVADGLESPTHLTSPPGDVRRLFVTEQAGRIRVIEDGELRPGAFVDIREKVGCCGERGLLSMAFHPDYAENGRFFVDYTNRDGDTVVSRFEVSEDPNVADPASEVVLFTIDQPRRNHNGGQIAFDADGFLYVGMGDGGGRGDPFENAQDDAALLGKLLRVDVDVESPPHWAAPADNPDPRAPGLLGLVWAKGLRNPWRFCFDRANDDLYVADVGQDEIEEIDYAAASSSGRENYGWDLFEGTRCFEPDPFSDCPEPSAAGITQPVYEYGRDGGCSVTGGFVYRGRAMPELHGTYFFADYCSNRIWSFVMRDGVAVDHRERTAELPIGASISSFGEDALGELYVVNLTGTIYRVVPRH